MSTPFEKWEDPVPASMFSPSQEAVDNILEEANKTPIRPSQPKRRMAVAVAAMALIIVGAAVGMRSLEALWGDRVLSGDGSPAIYPPVQMQAAEATDAPDVAQDPAGGAAPEAVMLEEENGGAKDLRGEQPTGESSAAPPPAMGPLFSGNSAAQAQMVDDTQQGENGTGSGKPIGIVALSSPEALCLAADAVVSGRFEEEGVFLVEEQLKGATPSTVVLQTSTLRGWALILLSEEGDGWELAQEPSIFRLAGEMLSARDAAGAPMPQYDAVYPGLTLEGMRQACAIR